MQGLFFFILTLFSLNAYSQQTTSDQPIKPNEIIRQELFQKIQDFTEAWSRSDTAALNKLLANEYRHSDIWGKILHKQDWLIYAAAPRKISDIHINDLELLLYNSNLAVATGKMSYLWGEEKLMQEIRFTQIWSNNDGQWKRTAFQATLIDKLK